jgi:hypothetical protein
MLRCTRIIPFSIHDKVETFSLTNQIPAHQYIIQPILHYLIEMFTGHRLRTENIQHLINHPANAINIAYYCRVSMERELAWGIEARLVNNEVRVTRLCGADTNITSTVEILFPRS